MTVTDLISFALLACASWRLVDATRTLRRVGAMHADADRRLNAAAAKLVTAIATGRKTGSAVTPSVHSPG